MPAQRAWTLFLFGVVLSTFVGGGVRVLLSPEVISRWVEEVVQKNQPKFNFKFESARLSLSDGWRPHLAVELKGLTITAKDKCVTESSVAIDRVIVPVEFRALIKKKVQFGHVRADLVDLTIRGSQCTARAADWTEWTSLESFFRKRWNKDFSNTTKYLRELSAESLRVREGASSEPKFEITNLQIEFLAQESVGKATFEFWPGVDWVGAKQMFGSTQTALHISREGIKGSAKGNLKEGQIHLAGSWRVEKSNVAFEASWTDVPLAPLVSLLTRWQMIDLKELEPRNQWSTCHLTARGFVREWRELKFQPTSCRLSGDFGDIEIASDEWQLLKGEMFPLHATLKQISLRRLAELFDVKPFKNISNFGFLNGNFAFENGRDWKASGFIQDVDIYTPIFDGNYKRSLGTLTFSSQFENGHYKTRVNGDDAIGLHLGLDSSFEKVATADEGTVSARFYSKPNMLVEDGTVFSFPFQNVDLKWSAKFDGHHISGEKANLSLEDIELRSDHPYYPLIQSFHLAQDNEPIRLQKANVIYEELGDGKSLKGFIKTSITSKDLQFETRIHKGFFQEGQITLLDNGNATQSIDLEGSTSRPTLQ